MRSATIANWIKIDLLGEQWETNAESTVDFDTFLSSLDVWLDVPLSEIQHVVHILPTSDWSGGLLGVRLVYRAKDLAKPKAEYLALRSAARDASTAGPNGEVIKIAVWPRSLTDFLERRLRAHVELSACPFDPTAVTSPSGVHPWGWTV